MKVEEIADAVTKLPPDQLGRFRRWFTAFEAGRINHAEELDSPATKLGRFAGRAFAELKGARTPKRNNVKSGPIFGLFFLLSIGEVGLEFNSKRWS